MEKHFELLAVCLYGVAGFTPTESYKGMGASVFEC